MCSTRAASRICAPTSKSRIRRKCWTATSTPSSSPASSRESDMASTTVAVITGATRGLGYSMADRLLAAGATVITLARSSSAGLADVAKQHGARLQQLQTDLSGAASIESAAGLMSAALPGGASRYLLINNAGTVDPVSLSDGLFDAAAIERAFNLNVTAAMVLSAAFLR